LYRRLEINKESVSKTNRKGNRCGKDENREGEKHK
jgi:hypothetical protein